MTLIDNLFSGGLSPSHFDKRGNRVLLSEQHLESVRAMKESVKRTVDNDHKKVWHKLCEAKE